MKGLFLKYCRPALTHFSRIVLDTHFCFWSRLYLARWRPEIVVVTGSVGKTNLLHILKEQLGDGALHSFKANTKIGVSLHMLEIEAISSGRQRWRWPLIILLAPFKALFKRPHRQKLYLVEYDAGDAYAAWYFKWWLRPHVCFWTTISPSHFAHFELKARLTGRGVYELIIAEFAAIAIAASERIFAPAADRVMRRALKDSKTPVSWVKDDLLAWQPDLERTVFKFPRRQFVFGHPQPRNCSRSLALLQAFAKDRGLKLKTDWRDWEPPVGRGRFFKGYGDSLLLDSSHNAQYQAFKSALETLQALPIAKSRKWLVAADMLEQGAMVGSSHRRLARDILQLDVDRVFLVGRRLKKHAYPLLKKRLKNLHWAEKVDRTYVDFFKTQISGGEVILFKGSAFLATLVKGLLADDADRRLLDKSSPPPVIKKRRAEAS